MPARFEKKEKLKQPSSRLYSSSMASPSPTRPKPLPLSLHRVYIARRTTISCALVVLGLFFVIFFTWKHAGVQEPNPSFYTFDIVNEFPHDPQAFTQGLLYQGNGALLESTGLYGRSTVRKVDLRSGKVELSYKVDGSIFGEGITVLGDRLLQVTWLTKTGLIYDPYNLSKIGRFDHPMKDGWGLATDGKIIFGSDGSSTLYQLDPRSWEVIKKATVKYNNHEIPHLNELEYVNGEVWANVWQDNGSVLSWILLHGLRQNLLRSGHTDIDVLNGIAWDEEDKRLFVTGKLWPKLYEIKLRPLTTPPFDGKLEKLCPTRGFR